MARILLIEPNYQNKYPPLGLMKIATAHKILGDEIVFRKGEDKTLLTQKWDKIYITTLFTFYWKQTIKTINFYKKALSSNILVGGILASLMPKEIFKITGVKSHVGPLLGPKNRLIEEIIKKNDQDLIELIDEISKWGVDVLPPDYSIFQDLSYLPYSKMLKDNYIYRTSQGCYRKCEYCSVNKMAPKFIQRIKIRPVINYVKKRWGEKLNLILLDDNILFSNYLKNIIKDLKELGFQHSTKGGKKKCYVDYNQGIDLRLLNKEKLMKLRELELKPIRIAFDDISLKDKYINILNMAVEVGFKEISSYLLYNYKDTPNDLYNRMRIACDLNEKLGCRIYSFPMKFVPTNEKNRSYIGKNWTKRQIRGLQCILNSTHGIVPVKKSFFENAFGENMKEFLLILQMPENYIINRNKPFAKKIINNWRETYNNFTYEEKEKVKKAISKGKNKIEIMNSENKWIKFIKKHYSYESDWNFKYEND